MLVMGLGLAHQAVHAFDHDAGTADARAAFAHKGTQHLVAHLDRFAAHLHLLFGPVAQPGMQPLGRFGGGLPITGGAAWSWMGLALGQPE